MIKLKKLCSKIRKDILCMIYNAKSGHIGGALGCVEYFVILYNKILNYNINKFDKNNHFNEDAFFLSNGHISAVYYSILSRIGYFSTNELSTFRLINSRLQGHPSTHYSLPGIRISSGSLGQGLSVAIGAALSKKINNEKNLVFSLHGDGELNEGQMWEAFMYAGSKKVDNLISTIDYNGKQIDGTTYNVMDLRNLKNKLKSFNWKVLEEKNGNNLYNVLLCLNKAKKLTFNKKPIAIILHTVMGYGIDFMMNDHIWHGKIPNKLEFINAINKLNNDLVV